MLTPREQISPLGKVIHSLTMFSRVHFQCFLLFRTRLPSSHSESRRPAGCSKFICYHSLFPLPQWNFRRRSFNCAGDLTPTCACLRARQPSFPVYFVHKSGGWRGLKSRLPFRFDALCRPTELSTAQRRRRHLCGVASAGGWAARARPTEEQGGQVEATQRGVRPSVVVHAGERRADGVRPRVHGKLPFLPRDVTFSHLR